MAKRKTKKLLNKNRKFPIEGKYIDTPTGAKLDVIYFVDDTGSFRVSIGNLPGVPMKGCRIQFKASDVKRKRRFYKKLEAFLNLSSGWRLYGTPEPFPPPLLFGLLKIRKGKIKRFVLIQSADKYVGSNTISVVAVSIDNLLYLDLIQKAKEKKK